MTASYAWCTYRDWSFQVLDGLLDLPGWRCGLIVTTPGCRTDLSRFERLGIPVLRIDPTKELKAGGAGQIALASLTPRAIFHYGWSWLVPPAVLDLCPNVTLHPGKLPKDRGGSPIQNQIRNGETWSYANIIQLVPGLDEGPVYDRERFSLLGDDVDAVWARMVSAGVVSTRRFLSDLLAGRAVAAPQDATVTPTVYKRVTPAQAELIPESQTARQMYDIVRAHNETDGNSYVVRAWLRIGDKRVVAERASLVVPAGAEVLSPTAPFWLTDTYAAAHAVNEGSRCLTVTGSDGQVLLLTRIRVAPNDPLPQTEADRA